MSLDDVKNSPQGLLGLAEAVIRHRSCQTSSGASKPVKSNSVSRF